MGKGENFPNVIIFLRFGDAGEMNGPFFAKKKCGWMDGWDFTFGVGVLCTFDRALEEYR